MPLPQRQGLYDPRYEHDACGVGFVANIKGEASHDIVKKGVDILLNLVHRGASGCDPLTGDGAGILMQVPHKFFKKACDSADIELPEPGRYGVGLVFLPRDRNDRRRCQQILEDKIFGTGQRLIGWRDVSVNDAALGPLARASAPVIRQVFIGSNTDDQGAFERKLFVIRRWAERTVRESNIASKGSFYLPSLSSRTIIYKGLLLAEQLAGFYQELEDPDMESALAMVHQRFSTNTFPTWELAQPFRVLAHNGEINTVRGNAAWMSAREQLFKGEVFGEDVRHILPTITPGGSDTAMLDNTAELLLQAGRSLPHVMMMLVPEAWQNDEQMPEHKKAFYEYHSCLVEPWDGPAALAFTDGKRIGGMLDRNGLRPARWTETKDGLVVLGSETGVLEFPAENIERKGRLEPGRMFLVDTEKGRIVEDEEIKDEICRKKAYGKWIRENKIALADIEASPPTATAREHTTLLQRQKVFGYTQEDLRLLMAPMAGAGDEPRGSMGTDTPLAVLSDRPQLVFAYFKQHFAQVTNPAIDPIREAMVMSLKAYIGGEGNILFELPDQAQMLELPDPILSNQDLAKLRETPLSTLRTPPTLPMLYPVAEGGEGLKAALDELCRQASLAVLDGHALLILSDRGSTEHMAPVPSLLATGAVHNHLLRNGTRMKVGIIVETGEAREVHHFCLLFGYGAGAVNPYLAFESLHQMAQQGTPGLKDPELAQKKYIKAVNKGLLKVMSKMGISTLQSYQGAQIFEAIGLSPDLIDRYFTNTSSRISGIDLDVIAEESRRRHDFAYPKATEPTGYLDLGGQYHYRAQGERHLWDPSTVSKLQHAVRMEDVKSYQEYSRLINDQSSGPITLRGLWELAPNGAPVPLEEVESAAEIVKRFATGAMSYGSISAEAHENLAIAMNRIGGRSNTGEGGESEERFKPDANGDLRRSSIKQVASGRFGVTTYYLVNADELQIKVSQGAKPGEGGELPGHKVDAIIAKTRHSTPGVTLISPPPHHDIYSIEDLKQLIHDLKCANPAARVHVKLVAEVGVGTVAAGVSKAKADVVLISGHDGGTGAAPLTSLKHAGGPWELGLAETQQTLLLNGLRDRIVVQVDGQLKTGRDVVIGALLGAEEFGFATAPLVVSGCVMMRVCHLDTCPVGVATQNPELRAKYNGHADHVVNFFEFIAQEVREILARLGFRSIAEAVGRVEALRTKDAIAHWKAEGLDLEPILHRVALPEGAPLHQVVGQDHGLDDKLDSQLLKLSEPALTSGELVRADLTVRNVDRTVGTILGHHVTRATGGTGLPENTIDLTLRGTAGQSFGAFLPRGITLRLVGDTNDYFGKGLSGGRLMVRPHEEAPFAAEEQIIAGNVIAYGATSGQLFIRGKVGERFCVRNSGATAVVEGVGDHACEYMTGGEALILGPTGRNLAAGMSGGVAWVLDLNPLRLNTEMVDAAPADAADLVRIRELLGLHGEETGSTVAEALLALSDAELGQRFTTVMPRDYARVLRARSEAESAGLGEEEVVRMMMEAAHG